jgi:ABC-type bacteriocin/lantibiotic exporter with double-glycine peptidase domain
MSVDSQRMIDFFLVVNTLWAAPLQIVIALILLWQQLGIATLAGMVFMIILFPFNGYITTKMRNIQILMMKEKDKRVKLMNETLNGIKVLKLYAWENSFRDQVMVYREKEVKSLNSIAFLNGGMVFTFVSAPFFVRY